MAYLINGSVVCDERHDAANAIVDLLSWEEVEELYKERINDGDYGYVEVYGHDINVYDIVKKCTNKNDFMGFLMDYVENNLYYCIDDDLYDEEENIYGIEVKYNYEEEVVENWDSMKD